MRAWKAGLVGVVFVSLTIASGCFVDYSFEQEQRELGTLGEELFKVWRKDAARSAENAEKKTALLDETYPEFVDAVDAIAPPEELEAVDVFLSNLLTLVDDGIVPALTRKLIVVLSEAAQDMALLRALATPTGPPADTFVSPDTLPNLLGYVTGFPDLVSFLRLNTRIILENDGFTDQGVSTFDESHAVSDLLRTLSHELRTDPAPGEEPLAVIVRDVALVEDPRYAPPENPSPAFVALYDGRGYPLASVDGAGVPVFPFTDADADGLADVDEGGFVLQSGDRVAIRPFAFESNVAEPVGRDAHGRATTPDGFAFQYVDLHRTALGFLVRQQVQLSSEDTLYDMLGAFKTVMGERNAVYTDEIGGYEGYPEHHPLTDLSHAAIHAVATPALPDVLSGVSELTARHPEALANLFWTLENVVDTLDAFPDAGMTDDQTIAYDLLPVLRGIVEDEQLWSDVMAALRDPVTRKAGLAYATMLSHRDSDSVPALDGPYDRCFQNCKADFGIGTVSRFDCIRACPMGEIFDEPMDFSAPESPETISAFQKFQHLLRDSQQLEYRMTIEQASYDGDPLPEVPPLIVLDASAEAMVAAIAGNLDLSNHVPAEMWDSPLGEFLTLLGVTDGSVASMVSTLSELFGAHMDVRPTPDQVTRLFNQPDIQFVTDRVVFDPADPVCHDGYRMSEHLAYGLFQAEASGLIDTMYPLAKAFSDNGREDLLVELMVVLHDHYAENADLYRTATGSPSPMKAANLRSYEPALLEVFTNGGLFEALADFAVAQYETEQATGIPVTGSLRQLLLQALSPTYLNRRQENFILADDGRTISGAGPLHHILASVDAAGARLDEDPASREELRESVSQMAELMIGTERDGQQPPRFANAGSIALTVHLTRYLAARAGEKRDDGTLSSWLTDDVAGSLTDFWRSRALAALIDLADETLADEQDKAVVDRFISYLFADAAGQAQVLVAIHELLVRSIAREQWLPVARFLAETIDPDRTWDVGEPYRGMPLVTLGALLLNETIDADPENTGIFLIHRGLERPPYQDSPFGVVIDIIARYLSPDPEAESFAKPQDYAHFLIEMASYLADDVHGVERLYELVGRRVKPDEIEEP